MRRTPLPGVQQARDASEIRNFCCLQLVASKIGSSENDKKMTHERTVFLLKINVNSNSSILIKDAEVSKSKLLMHFRI